MAGLAERPSSGALARRQFVAVAWLRWRLFVNGLRRKGGKGELVAALFLIPFAVVVLVGPVVGAGAAAYAAVRKHHTELLSVLFWLAFAFQIVLSINIAPPSLPFDPQALIRFPLAFPRYLAIRLMLGLLALSTVVGTLTLLMIVAGVTAAQSSLGPAALGAALALALTNMLFIRMVFAWVDRWLSTRRSREVMTGAIVVVSIAIQWANFTFNPGLNGSSSHGRNAAHLAALKHLLAIVAPIQRVLPPGLAGSAIVGAQSGPVSGVLLPLAGVLGFAALFLAAFAARMHREYRGENLSETSSREPEATSPAREATATPALGKPARVQAAPGRAWLSPALSACMRKEILYTRRNTAQFYALIAPLAMVFLFTARMSRHVHGASIFPAATAYAVLGASALAYNCFGLDGPGMQFYLLSPVPLRTVVLAKNLVLFCIVAIDLVLVLGVVIYSSGFPAPWIMLATLTWVIFATAVNVTLGNWRSITAPKKVDPAKPMRNQNSQLSGLIAVGVMLVMGAAGFGLLTLGTLTGLPWLPFAVVAVLAAAAALVYRAMLARIGETILEHREGLLEELTKAA